MGKPKTKYQKPSIKQKRINVSFFLSNIHAIDSFNFIGDVYAQSPSCDSSGSCGGACDCGCGSMNSESGTCQSAQCGCGCLSCAVGDCAIACGCDCSGECAT